MDITHGADGESIRKFEKRLLDDLRCLKQIIKDGKIESGVRRVGAEQEVNFIDAEYRPSLIADQIYPTLEQGNFTKEFARFNFEINSPPYYLKESCFTSLETFLKEKIEYLNEKSEPLQSRIILAGTLPSITEEYITSDALTREDRYKSLHKLRKRLRGENYELHIKGKDELISRDDDLLFDACSTSFQIHYQLNPDDGVDTFNWAQMISGPLMACCVNSPIFLNKQLWDETRIALFKQSTELRKPYDHPQNEASRVTFGHGWLKKDITEVYEEEIAKYKTLMVCDSNENSLEAYELGEIPKLETFNFYTGTIYSWNRICYGTLNNIPSLRIENRFLPAGPSIMDQVANAAFWTGMLSGITDKYKNLQKKFDFDSARENFVNASQLGLNLELKWLDNRSISASKLILDELLPLAYEGLNKIGVDEKDIEKYLGVIKERVKTGQTGASWQKSVLNHYLHKDYNIGEAALAITAAMLKNQNEGTPVHTWKIPSDKDFETKKIRFNRIDQIMRRKVYTVQEEDLLHLALNIMQWKEIGHLIVVNQEGDLKGVVNRGSVINYLTENNKALGDNIAVKEIMVTKLITATPDMPVSRAIQLIMENDISCLPVIRKNKLVGLVTEHDFVRISKNLLTELDKQYD